MKWVVFITQVEVEANTSEEAAYIAAERFQTAESGSYMVVEAHDGVSDFDDITEYPVIMSGIIVGPKR